MHPAPFGPASALLLALASFSIMLQMDGVDAFEANFDSFLPVTIGGLRSMSNREGGLCHVVATLLL